MAIIEAGDGRVWTNMVGVYGGPRISLHGGTGTGTGSLVSPQGEVGQDTVQGWAVVFLWAKVFGESMNPVWRGPCSSRRVTALAVGRANSH